MINTIIICRAWRTILKQVKACICKFLFTALVETKEQPSPCKPVNVQEACTTNMLAKENKDNMSPPEGSPLEGSRIVNLKQLASFVGEVSDSFL